MRCRFNRHNWVSSIALGTALLAPVAAAEDDYLHESEAWNGLSSLVRVFGEHEVDLEWLETLDLTAMTEDDAILVVHPRSALPNSQLASFIRGGGRVALAEDFGPGAGFLNVYRIGVSGPLRSDAPALRSNPSLPLARPRVRHPLTDGIAALATNHPRTLTHASLDPLFSLDEEKNAVVLAGAVGDGRLVAIGDPSILINNMLLVKDNTRFAANLARYLSPEPGRVFLVTPSTEIAGGDQDGHATDPFASLRESVREFAAAELPPVALTILSLALVLSAAVLAVSMLPRRSPYDGRRMFATHGAAGGFVGRVEFFSRPRQNLLHPALVYKFELESELLRRLRLRGTALLRDVVEALRTRGFRAVDIERARTLLLTLDDLREKQDHPPSQPVVTPQRFRALVAEGEELLRRIDETNSA